jgi:hypothetical protein
MAGNGTVLTVGITASNETWKWSEIIGRDFGSIILFDDTYRGGVEVTEETPVTVTGLSVWIWTGAEPFEYKLGASSAD